MAERGTKLSGWDRSGNVDEVELGFLNDMKRGILIGSYIWSRPCESYINSVDKCGGIGFVTGKEVGIICKISASQEIDLRVKNTL